MRTGGASNVTAIVSSCSDSIRREVAQYGVIPFKRFMELALYCPEYGFYEQSAYTTGRSGEYYTSVSVGPLFGQLLAVRFAQWLQDDLGDHLRNGLQIVEAGAHRGEMAADLLGFIREHRPALWDRLQYWIIEPSPRRRGWQQSTLATWNEKIRWFPGWGEVEKVEGLIFSNELLDSMPVHRFGWNRSEKAWFEWGVTLGGDRFQWAPMRPLSREEARLSELPELTAALAEVLPDGYVFETCPAAAAWIRSAGGKLGRGRLITIDYGLDEIELLSPHRLEGTLRGYRSHRVTRDLLANPGEQDLTAHVNWTSIQRAAAGCGLVEELLTSQANFLVAIASEIWQGRQSFGRWGSVETRQFQTLTHPEHLGTRFRVLVHRSN
jgi:SAM-dependent MidA family methyltransferase